MRETWIKLHFDWWKKSIELAKLTPQSSLGFLKSDLTTLDLLISLKGLNDSEPKGESVLAERFNEDGKIKEEWRKKMGWN